ncbi:MAG: hypothetical protein K9L22_01410 [Methylococcaceae bacterium]|nr:hypothetical protein [Methylococcaceae bacterium]
MKKFKLLLASVPLLLINNVYANALHYKVEVVYFDDTVFTGEFDYDATTQKITNLHGQLDDTLMQVENPPELLDINYQLNSYSDGKGGITAYAYAMNTTEITTDPPINNNVMVAINFNASNPTLGPTDLNELAYMDCSYIGLMGNTCMYHLAYHDPVFPMDGGHGILSETITLADNQVPSPVDSSATSSDCLFNWAEQNYSVLFAPAAMSQTLAPYYYRYYSEKNAYLGVNTADNHVYYLGADNTLLDVGSLSEWLPRSGC